MLVMRRREGEAIVIGDEVEVRILSIDRTRVKIGIVAPRSIQVSAREMELVRQENRQAAESSCDASEVAARILKTWTTAEGPKKQAKPSPEWPI